MKQTGIVSAVYFKGSPLNPMVTYFGEVANNVCSLFVHLSENVEDKRLHVKVQRLVVEK